MESTASDAMEFPYSALLLFLCLQYFDGHEADHFFQSLKSSALLGGMSGTMDYTVLAW